jgi:hypothetical protein
MVLMQGLVFVRIKSTEDDDLPGSVEKDFAKQLAE